MRVLAALAAVLLASPVWAATTRTTTVYLPAGGCRDTTPGAFFSLPTSTQPGPECVMSANAGGEGILAYDKATTERAIASYRLPASWVSASGINASIAWRSAQTTGDVRWCVQLACSANDETINPGFPALSSGNCVNDTTLAGSDNMNLATITGVTATDCAAGEVIWVQMAREGGDAADTADGDADFISLELTMVDSGITLESAATGVLGGVQLDDDLGGTAASPDVVDVTCTGCIDATNLATDSCAGDEIAADSVALTTDTTGNYVTSVATSVLTGLTGGAAASEGATLTLGLDYSQALTGDVGLAANACVFGTSGLVCEGATANTIELFVAVPDAASTDKTLTLPNETGTVCSTGSVCTGYQAGPLTGDVTTTGAAATIAANSVALETDTTGNFVESITTSVLTGLTGGLAAAEGTEHTLGFDYSQALTGDVGLAANACVFGTSGLVCEGATADTIELFVAVPDAASTDKTLTLPNETGTLCSTGAVCTGYQAGPLTGDVTTTGAAATIADNSVDGTDIAIGSDAQGDVLYYNGTDWARLGFGTVGYKLTTQGTGANPTWAADDDVPDAGEVDDTALAAGAVDGGNAGEIADASITADDLAADSVGTSEVAFNYVASVATSVLTGLTGGAAGSEGAALTLGFDYSQALSGDVGLAANACVFGTSGLVCEGATADTIELFVAVPDPATADKTLTLPNETGTILTSATTATKSIYWPADALDVDGTQCTKTAAVAINSGPLIGYINCADNAAGVIYGRFTTPDSWNAGTVTLEVQGLTVDASVTGGSDDTIGWDVSCMVRRDGDAINNTWGTAQDLDLVFATQYVEEQVTSAAVTCNGTAAAGATVYWRAVVDATVTDTTVADFRIMGFKLEYGVTAYTD